MSNEECFSIDKGPDKSMCYFILRGWIKETAPYCNTYPQLMAEI